jgi:nucleotide-binding universal stress UspA family protein
MHVMPPIPLSSGSPLAAASRQLTAKNLDAAINRWRQPGVDVKAELIESANPSDQIMKRAESLDVDVVVTGSHGRKGVQRLLLGSVVEPLLHRCRQPVLVIPAALDEARLNQPVAFKRILCAVDFSASSLTALAYALSIAEEADARLTLVNAIEMPPELANPPQPPDYNIEDTHREAVADRLTRLRALIPAHVRDYCTVETAVVEGGASRQILHLAGEQAADLIVLGVHGRNTLDLAVFGSNSKDVITRAHCPVLIVPATRWRDAVREPSRVGHAKTAFVF